jgi:predicted transcriptional regulator
MKKIILLVITIMLSSALNIYAAELKVGEKAPNFSLKDSLGKVFTLDSSELQGKVLSVYYVNPDEKDLNNHMEEALREDPGLEHNTRYKGLGISNLKASKMPSFLIKSAIKSKQEKTGATILLDYEHTISDLWGLKKDTSSIVILDKERICRYVYTGKLPPVEVEKVLKVIKEYQVK